MRWRPWDWPPYPPPPREPGYGAVGVGELRRHWCPGLGLQRGQGYRPRLVHVGDVDGHVTGSGVAGAVGGCHRNFVYVVRIGVGLGLEVGSILKVSCRRWRLWRTCCCRRPTTTISRIEVVAVLQGRSPCRCTDTGVPISCRLLEIHCGGRQ